MKELFLACALSLRPAVAHFHGWEGNVSSREFLTVYRELKTFLNKIGPGREFIVMPHRIHAVPNGYYRLPFSFRGHAIYERKSA